jgi:aldose 1-epimerase
VGWERPWFVRDTTDTYALLVYEHQADAAWPFNFEASQSVRLETNALELGLSITNRCASVAPAGLGWHPYFVKRADARVRFDATGRWEMGDDKLPTHRCSSTGVDDACASLEVDHCFDGWSGVVELNDALLRTRMVSRLSRLVVYTTPERDTIAIEPVSHVNDAVNRMALGVDGAVDLGVRMLQPGETFSATLRIEVERA